MIALLNGNALSIPLADNSVQCVVTSPPYWGLRDYGTATWQGGDLECDHRIDRFGNRKITEATKIDQSNQKSLAGEFVAIGKLCPKCGARRIDAQLGLEATPALYVASIVAVMRECWRVLKDDGTLWLVIGDSYASAWAVSRRNVIGNGSLEHGKRDDRPNRLVDGLKEKDLIGIPWRVAFALQDAGWYLRSDIIWHKPNPMPESVTDRPTKSHEYVFLLTKQARYYYDAEAIQEKAATGWNGSSFTDERDQLTKPNLGMKPRGGGFSQRTHDARRGVISGGTETGRPLDNGFRNRRDVWTVSTLSYSGAHFATFPPKLVEPMILAGSRRGDVVLDPFSGSGTVGAVCAKHGRSFVGVELNPKYIELAHDRTSNIQMELA